MERKRLINSQRELLFIRRANVEQAQASLQNTLTSIALESGVPETELGQWVLNDKAEYFEKAEAPKNNPKGIIPKNKK